MAAVRFDEIYTRQSSSIVADSGPPFSVDVMAAGRAETELIASRSANSTTVKGAGKEPCSASAGRKMAARQRRACVNRPSRGKSRQ